MDPCPRWERTRQVFPSLGEKELVGSNLVDSAGRLAVRALTTCDREYTLRNHARVSPHLAHRSGKPLRSTSRIARLLWLKRPNRCVSLMQCCSQRGQPWLKRRYAVAPQESGARSLLISAVGHLQGRAHSDMSTTPIRTGLEVAFPTRSAGRATATFSPRSAHRSPVQSGDVTSRVSEGVDQLPVGVGRIDDPEAEAFTVVRSGLSALDLHRGDNRERPAVG